MSMVAKAFNSYVFSKLTTLLRSLAVYRALELMLLVIVFKNRFYKGFTTTLYEFEPEVYP